MQLTLTHATHLSASPRVSPTPTTLCRWPTWRFNSFVGKFVTATIVYPHDRSSHQRLIDLWGSTRSKGGSRGSQIAKNSLLAQHFSRKEQKQCDPHRVMWPSRSRWHRWFLLQKRWAVKYAHCKPSKEEFWGSQIAKKLAFSSNSTDPRHHGTDPRHPIPSLRCIAPCI